MVDRGGRGDGGDGAGGARGRRATRGGPDRACGGARLLYTIGAAVVVGLAAPFLVPLLFGDDFSDAAIFLALLLPGIVAYAPVTILVVYLSVRRGRPRLSLAVSVVAMVLTTAAALVLIPRYGGAGAAVASTIGYAAGGLLAWVFFGRVAGLGWFGRARVDSRAGG